MELAKYSRQIVRRFTLFKPIRVATQTKISDIQCNVSHFIHTSSSVGALMETLVNHVYIRYTYKETPSENFILTDLRITAVIIFAKVKDTVVDFVAEIPGSTWYIHCVGDGKWLRCRGLIRALQDNFAVSSLFQQSKIPFLMAIKDVSSSKIIIVFIWV